jgi:hypothetical protein
MKAIVVSRSEARSGTVKKASVPCGKGTKIIPVRVPAGVRNKQSILVRKERLPPDADWPDNGFTFPVHVYDRRPLHVLVGIIVVAGVLGYAAGYAIAVAAAWGLILLCDRYSREHAPDIEDPATGGRLWHLLRYNLAKAGILYLTPIGLAVAVYVCLAAGLTLFDESLTVGRLQRLQGWFEASSTYFTDTLKLREYQVFALLIGAYLITCALLSWQGRGASTSRGWRLRAARIIRGATDAYCRYSGPIAAGLATLAAFTFLGVRAGDTAADLQLRLKLTDKTYADAAKRVQADLSHQVTEQIYAKIKQQMPADYQCAGRGHRRDAEAGARTDAQAP